MRDIFYKVKIWIKEYFKKCPLKKQFTQGDPPLMIIGHRGSIWREAENTFPAFELALKEGSCGLETDLCLTKDGHVIIWHDWDPNDKVALLREAGFEPWVCYKPHPPSLLSPYRKPVNQLTLEEIRANYDYKERKKKIPRLAHAHIPTIEEFFVWAKDKPRLKYVFFDNKAPEADKECAVEILDRIKELKDKFNPDFEIVIETTFLSCYEAMKEKYPEFNYSFDIEPAPGFVFEPIDYSPLNHALNNNDNYAIGLRPRKITVANWTTFRRIMRHDVAKLRRLRKNGTAFKRLLAATITKRKELKCLVRLGIDGIQTDYPLRLKRIAQKYGREIE